MSGALDRTGEFQACTRSFHQRVFSGLLILKPPHPKSSRQFDYQKNNLISEISITSKNMSQELKMTHSKLTKLKLLLQSSSQSPTEVLNKLIDIIQCDVVDLNKTKVELKSYVSKLKDQFSHNIQYFKHLSSIVIGLEFHLSYLITEFRSLLETQKVLLSANSKQKSNISITNAQKNMTSDSTVNTTSVSLNKHQQYKSGDFSNMTSLTSEFSEKPQTFPHSTSNNAQFNLPDKSNLNKSTSVPLLLPTASYPESVNVSQQKQSNCYISSPSPLESPTQSMEQIQLYANSNQISMIDQEVRQRDAAVQRVESTIVQLGEIYQQFSTLIQEQNDYVLRIDNYTDNIEININEAHVHLIKFMRYISGQRGLLCKIFITILICFSLFAWIVK